nr:hypothetical protein [Verrucomicrobiota bacterium]
MSPRCWPCWFLAVFLSLVLSICALGHDVSVIAVANLSDPAKIATLKSERAANDRLLKILGWLHEGFR